LELCPKAFKNLKEENVIKELKRNIKILKNLSLK